MLGLMVNLEQLYTLKPSVEHKLDNDTAFLEYTLIIGRHGNNLHIRLYLATHCKK